jgi:2'-hydroxyisoflavone reductase
MDTTRRLFLQLTGAAGASIGLQGLSKASAEAITSQHNQKSLKILILGGTQLIGPSLVEAAIANGHTVTLFNRGKTNTHLFPDVEKLRGDRDDNLASLENREWDVVIDNSANIPRWVRMTTELLKDSVGLYLFTSSVSAFKSFEKPGMDETAPVAELEDKSVEQITGDTFGGMKALGEQFTREAFGERALIVRPGLIVGPGDVSDRFTYWPVRIHEGGEIIAPGDPTDLIQMIDVRDLAEFYVRLVEHGAHGTYNATGPSSPWSIAEMLYGIRATTSADMQFTWVDADFLEKHGVQPWGHMPVWLPPRDGYEGFGSINISKALEAGLTFRPLADTVQATLTFWNSLSEERRAKPRAGLAREKEKEVLAAWHARNETPAAEDTPAEG